MSVPASSDSAPSAPARRDRLHRLIGGDPVGLLGLGLFVTVAVLPIVISLGYAALYSIGAVGLLSDGLTLAHWRTLVESTEIIRSFGWSLYIAATTTVLAVGIALGITLLLRRRLARGWLSYVVYFPLAIPGTVAAFVVFQVLSGAGFASRVALHLGLIAEQAQFPNLVQDAWGIGILVAHVGLAVPFFTLLFLQIYTGERIQSLLSLAATLGATPAQQIRRVAVPILLKRAFTNILLLFVAVLGSYEIPLLLDQQSPQMLSVLTMRKYALFNLHEKPEAFIIALLYTALVGTLIALAFRYGRDAFDA